MNTNGTNGIPPDFEEVESEYLSEVITRPPYTLYRADGGGDRWYWCPEKARNFPSVTNVIGATVPPGPGLVQFFKNEGRNADQIAFERAEYGTMMHIVCKDVLLSESYDLGVLPDVVDSRLCAGASRDRWLADIRKDVLAFHAWRLQHKVKPIAVEIPLASDKLGTAGAIDLVCDMIVGTGKYAALTAANLRDGTGVEVRTVVDWKSRRKPGFFESHEYQLLLYKDLWEENYPKLPIDRILNWSPKDWKTSPSFNLKDQTESKYAANIPHILEIFHNGRSGPGSRLVISGTLEPDTPIEDLYRRVEPAELLDA